MTSIELNFIELSVTVDKTARENFFFFLISNDVFAEGVRNIITKGNCSKQYIKIRN